jgi:hypothetical protein
VESKHLFMFAAALGCVAILVWAVETWLGRIRDAIVDEGSKLRVLINEIATQHWQIEKIKANADAYRAVMPRPMIDPVGLSQRDLSALARLQREAALAHDRDRGNELIANVRRTMPPSRPL